MIRGSLGRILVVPSLFLLFLAASPLVAAARPANGGEKENVLLAEPANPGKNGVSGVFSAAAQETTYFGGTVWAPDSMRWEAIRDSCWTFDTGVGSHFDHDAPYVNPYKDPGLHAYMEGWVGVDGVNPLPLPYFRRLGVGAFAGGDTCVGAAAGLGGDFSFWAGVLPEEADALCYAAGQGYGDNWFLCIGHEFSYGGGGGTVAWSFGFVSDTEPGFDYSYFFVDTTCSSSDGRIGLQTNTGAVSGMADLTLTPGVNLRSTPGCYRLEICAASDGAYSDEDGLYETSCGALSVDDVSVIGGGENYYSGFESNDGGWEILLPDPSYATGDWSDVRAVSDLPPVLAPCACTIEDSVLVFFDDEEEHGYYQDDMAVSPWIDLGPDGADLVGSPGKFIQFEGYFALPLLNYVFVGTEIQWYPETCPHTGKLVTSEFHSDGYLRYFGGAGSDCSRGDQPLCVHLL